MVEFLILMVALDKIWFTPLGKFMDERDAAIREKLSNVKDTSKEVKQLEEQLAEVMRALGLHLKFSSITLILGNMKVEETTMIMSLRESPWKYVVEGYVMLASRISKICLPTHWLICPRTAT
ncbi:hypothetical protein K2173_009007 [Erythroxylum novogranatense]|uniref:Uncharacterized protein n=1 Tax=Erythroxylum novogranatense TaxID=1862640 RepID=A0AAV8TUM2_9ROSI|nr:hypothetical protein K2173_009007 [Erythroxylum novogranatense]